MNDELWEQLRTTLKSNGCHRWKNDRQVMEAILWHGGEAEASKQQVLQFNEADRQALVKFVESL